MTPLRDASIFILRNKEIIKKKKAAILDCMIPKSGPNNRRCNRFEENI